MQIKKQSIAFNILNNFKGVNDINPIEQTVELVNDNFNKGLIDELTVEQAFEQLDNVIQKSAPHKYFKREGTPGNYKYYYTEDEYNKEKEAKGNNKDFKLKHLLKQTENKFKQINISSIENHLKELSQDSRIKDLKGRLAMDCFHLVYNNKEISSLYKDESIKDTHVLTLAKTALDNIINIDKVIESLKEETKDKKEDGNIVDNVNNGEVINSLFKEWNSIKTSEQHKEWAKKVANTKFGTYEDKTILNVMSDFNPKFPNEIIKKDFINEIREAYKNSGGSERR